MTYIPLARPANLPPRVERLVWKLERHYLTPVHAMFRLPLPHYAIVCEIGFSICNQLLAAVAGISTTLYKPTGNNTSRFINVLLNYYPFRDEPAGAAPGDQMANALWEAFRNPLAHNLGFAAHSRAKRVNSKVLRTYRPPRASSGSQARGLSELQVQRMECDIRPTAKPTVALRDDATVLSLESLYWGTRQLTQAILRDVDRMQRAEAHLESLRVD